jgi:hypothetical protein
MRRSICALGIVLLVGAWSAPAAAQKGGKQKGGGRVVSISEVMIVGRVQKPIAATAVSRIEPRLTLAELKQPFARRIEQAIYREPF